MPSLTNNSAGDLNAIRILLSIATKLFDQHPNFINVKRRNFNLVVNFKKNSFTEVEKVIEISVLLNLVKNMIFQQK